MKAAQTPTENADGTTTNWQQLCGELKAKCDSLSRQVGDLKAERDTYLRAVYALTFEDIEVDKEAMLAQAVKGQSLRELIDELKSQYGT